MPDAAPPSVSITYPLDGDTFEAGADFDVMVDALDDTGIEAVQLFNNGMALQDDASEPYGWGVTNIPEGEYTLHVVATDYAGNETMSNMVTIYVGIDPPPTADGGSGDGGTADGGGDDGDGTDSDSNSLPDADGRGGDDGGCGCTTSPEPAPLMALGLVALLGLRRRRRH
jgi:MYXO-CTERM domain-containing protein